MHLAIAGLTIEVTAAPDVTLALGPSAARFAVEPRTADVSVHASREPLSADISDELIFDSGGLWRLHRNGDGFLFRIFSSAFGPAPYKTARFANDFTSGTIALNAEHFGRNQPVDPLEYPLDELLVINLLGRGRGLEVHGCGVIAADGRGYLFVGQSGAGKTTMARLWLADTGTTILSDDRVVLRIEPDGVWMFGTPWHGEAPLASPARVRLSHVFFLQQSLHDRLEPIGAAAAAARLLASSFPPFHDPSAMAFSLQFVGEIVNTVSHSVLGFVPGPDVPQFVRCAGMDRRSQI